MATKTLDTVEIVRNLVAALTPIFLIDAAVLLTATTYRLETFDTFWLRPFKTITIDGKQYQITDFVINESITIKDVTLAAGIPTVMSFPIPAPNFFHGTPVMMNNEHSRNKAAKDKTPFIWLQEVLEETAIDDRRSAFGRTSSPRIFFMDQSKLDDWTSEQHKVNAIEPARQMTELFFANIRADRSMFGEIKNYKSTNRANWGKFLADKGNIKLLVNQNVSGVETFFDFEMTKKACDRRLSGIICTIGVIMSKTDPTTQGGSDGTATANEFGDQSTVTYLWTTIDGSIPAGEEIKKTATGLVDGTYTVVVKDNITDTCTATDSVTLEDPIIVGFGNALRFDGANDKVDHTSDVLIGASQDYTYQFMFRSTNPSGNQIVIRGVSGTTRVFLFLDTDQIRVRNSGTSSFFDTPTFLINIWYHIVISRISGTIRLYIDGVESSTGGLVNSGVADYEGLSDTNFPFVGDLDKIGILVGTGAIQSNVTDLYNGGSASDFKTIMGGANLVYEMDESGSTSVAPDTSGNSNDGTLVNFVFTPSPWIAH